MIIKMTLENRAEVVNRFIRKITGLKSQKNSFNSSRDSIESRYALTEKQAKKKSVIEPTKVYTHMKRTFKTYILNQLCCVVLCNKLKESSNCILSCKIAQLSKIERAPEYFSKRCFTDFGTSKPQRKCSSY